MTIQLGSTHLRLHVETCVERSPTPCRPIGEPLDAPPGFELRIMDPPHRHSYTNDDEDAPLAMMVQPRQRPGFVTDESPSSPPPPILLEQRVHRVANIQTSTSCLGKRPNRISRHEKVRKRRCMERRGRRCLDVWEDEGQQPNLGGDEVMVAPPSSITRMSRPPCTDGIHDDIARTCNIATISGTPVNPLPSDDTYTSQSAHSDDAASTTDSDAPEDDDYLATVTIDVGKEGLCTRRRQIPCLSDMSTWERELNNQATTSGPPPQRVEGTPPSTNTHMFELDEHYMVQKEFEAGSTVILWHPDHTSGMRVVGTTILETSFMDGIWELTAWEFKEGFEDVPHPLSMSHRRTLADVGICMPDARRWYGRHQICVLMQHLRSLDLGKQ